MQQQSLLMQIVLALQKRCGNTGSHSSRVRGYLCLRGAILNGIGGKPSRGLNPEGHRSIKSSPLSTFGNSSWCTLVSTLHTNSMLSWLKTEQVENGTLAYVRNRINVHGVERHRISGFSSVLWFNVHLRHKDVTKPWAFALMHIGHEMESASIDVSCDEYWL